MHRANLAISIFASTLLTSCSPSNTSVLDQPIEQAKARIAAAARCTWANADGYKTTSDSDEDVRLHRCDRDSLDRNWVFLEVTPEGKIDSISFHPLLAEDYPQFRELPDDSDAVAKAISKLLPEWADAETWTKSALTKAKEGDFQTSTRVGSTSVYVTENKHSNEEGRFASLVLTKALDLTKYKKYPCGDDDQGPGLDKCRDRNYERPAENPILHLR